MESWIPNPNGSATWTPTLEVSAGKVWHRSQYGQLARLDGREFVLVAHGNNNFVGDVSIDLGGSFGTVTVVVAIHDGDAPGSRLVSMVPFWRERTHVMVGRSTTAEAALP